MEILLSKLQAKDFETRIADLQKGAAANDSIMRDSLQKALATGQSSSPALEEMRKKAMNEQLDTKIQNAFEQLRNDNLFIWKQSLELAQKEFTEKGVSQTMNMLPKTLLDRGDLKRTVNSLLLEENSLPQPQMVGSGGVQPPSQEPDGMSFKSGPAASVQKSEPQKPEPQPA